ncbi:MAG: 5-guanidino-2-oxopentanoate decarboxylase [Pseudomonadales bacterium]
MLTCGVALSRLLERYDVDVVYGIPGNHTLELYRGLDDSPIRHITTRHEQGAAFMADGYARASGKVGVCCLISGPGLLNAATALGQALADSIPVLVITAVTARAAQGQGLGLLHDMPDQQAAARSFARQSLSLTRAEDLPTLIQHAFTLLTQERPGPVHLQIPLDLMTAPVNIDLFPKPTPKQSPVLSVPTEIAQALSASLAPLLLLGGGAVRTAPEELRRFAEQLDAPVLNTVNAKGLMPPGHPLAVGGSPSLPCLQQAINQADLVIAIGTEFSETDYDLLMAEPLKRSGKLLRVDIDEAQLQCNQHADLVLLGDAAAWVPALNAALKPAQREGRQRTATLRGQIPAESHYHPDLQRFFDTLQGASDTLTVVGDSTRPTYYATWQYEATAPRRYFHSVSGFGTLGYAIPAAMGAALGTSDSVVALIGDGGAQFTLTEFATATDNALPVTFIIWCNRGYEEIENSLEGRGVSNRSTDISSPDFALVGAAYGMSVYQPVDWAALATDLQLALKEAQQTGQPNLMLVQQDQFVSTPSGQWY